MKDFEQETVGGVKMITPRHVLREKIGYGGIDPAVMERAEEHIAKNDVDFQPYAKGFLERIEQAVAVARPIKVRNRDAVDMIVNPVMELKANGGMFKYPLVTEIADIMLDFLEGLNSLNDDALDLVEVHQKTLHAIIGSKLSGDGGKAGKALANELYRACKRYHKKHPTPKKG
ncbi:MAG TPA: hypothetical protein VIF12_05815 [Micavibrio sp.]|jgi:hypothetical protein